MNFEDEADFTDPFVPTYVNSEPVVLAGLTDLELMGCISLSVLLTLAISIVVGFFWLGFHAFVLFIALSLLVGFISVRILRSLKQGRPKGYINARVRLWMAQWFGVGSLYLKDVPLKIGRSSQPIIVVKGSSEE